MSWCSLEAPPHRTVSAVIQQLEGMVNTVSPGCRDRVSSSCRPFLLLVIWHGVWGAPCCCSHRTSSRVPVCTAAACAEQCSRWRLLLPT